MKTLLSRRTLPKAPTPMMRCFFLVFIALMSCEGWSATNPPSGTIEVPPRIGVSSDAHNRTVSGKATVSPASEAVRCTITPGSNKVTISNIVNNNGTITFDIVGTSKDNVSEKPDDIDVKLVHSSAGVLATDTTCVVIPKRIVKPHQVPPPSTPTPNNMLANENSTPAHEAVAAPDVSRITFYGVTLTVQVEDQLKMPCGDIYAGSEITESESPINQQLTAASTYSDPVGILFLKDGQNGFWPPGSPQAQAWPTDPPAPAQNVTRDISRAVEVDGFVLEGGTGPRTATLTSAGLLTINWP